MKILSLGFALAFFAQSANALDCHYDYRTGKFTVSNGAARFEHSARSRFDHARLLCVTGAAALYDGDEWVVFNALSKEFSWTETERDADNTESRASSYLMALMDNAAFHVYDIGTQKFESMDVTPDYRSFRLSVGDRAAALYDGYSYFLYDSVTGKITKEKTREKYAYAKLDAIGAIVAFYNGDRWKLTNFLTGQTHEVPSQTSAKRAWQVASADGAMLYDGNNLMGYSATKDLVKTMDISAEVGTYSVPSLRIEKGKFRFQNPGQTDWLYDPLTGLFSRP